MPHISNFLTAIDPATRAQVMALAAEIEPMLKPGDVVVLAADNSLHWLYADLALQACGAVVIPLPGFFSTSQTRKILQSHPVRALIGERSVVEALQAGGAQRSLAARDWMLELLPPRGRDPGSGPHAAVMPPGSKLTFTSGSTGDPKAVLITPAQQWPAPPAIAARA